MSLSAAQLLHSIFQAAKYFCSKAVAGHANYKETVGPLVENEFDWHAGIGTAEDACKWTLLWCAGAARRKTQIPRVDGDDSLYHTSLVLDDLIEELGEVSVAVVQSNEGCIAIRKQRSCRRIARLIPIGDVNRFQNGLLAFA